MTERHLGAIKATSTDIMPTTGTKWLEGDLPGGGEFALSVSNTEPTLTLTVTIPGIEQTTERIDIQPLINRWVLDIARDRAIQN